MAIVGVVAINTIFLFLEWWDSLISTEATRHFKCITALPINLDVFIMFFEYTWCDVVL